MGPDVRGVSSWEDGFLTVVVTVFFLLSGADLWLAWLNRRRD